MNLDNDRFEREWRRVEPGLVRLLRRWTGGIGHDDREDLLQTARLRAWNAFPRYRESARFGAWAAVIVHNVCVNFHIRRKRRLELDGVPLMEWCGEDAGPSPLDIVTENDLSDEMTAALAGIPEQFRAPLLLLADDHGYDEIAAILACPVGTVRSRISRARDKMGALLAA